MKELDRTKEYISMDAGNTEQYSEKNHILQAIELQINKLDKMDVEGHVWWGKFKDFIEFIL